MKHSLPSAPSSRPIHQDTLRGCKASARDHSVMCNQTAGFSWCLTEVQESVVTQLKVLHGNKGKGKSFSISQQAVDELDYLVRLNRIITQAMAHTMQDLSEGIIYQYSRPDISPQRQLLELSLSQNQAGYTHCPA